MLSWLAAWLRRSRSQQSVMQSPPSSLKSGGYVPVANLHSLHPGELVLNRDTVGMVQKMMSEKELPTKLHKRLTVLLKRRPQKVSRTELKRVTDTMARTPSMLAGAQRRKRQTKTTTQRPAKTIAKRPRKQGAATTASKTPTA